MTRVLPACVSMLIVAWLSPAVQAGDAGFQYEVADASDSSWQVALQFATADDAEAFHQLAVAVDALPPPDAPSVARAFLRERFDIEGDDHVVAHFRSGDDRRKGVPDHAVSLTEALMEAFPDHARHSFFAEASDLVGGLNNGGAESPGIVLLGEQLWHADSAKEVFANLGRFLWSRTGPGYLYNTFFAKGNVIETVGEDHRALDEAFGIYRAGGFTKDHESGLSLSRLVEAFKAPGAFAELPYVRKLNGELDAYWRANKTGWRVLARYQFVLRAKLARDARQLTQAQYELVMHGGAPQVPLDGPVSMAQLRSGTRRDGVDVRSFDINGYTATNLLRFIAADGSEVMYLPGRTPSFVVAANERALRKWVLDQARDPTAMDALLSHFSIRDKQDGVFWTGVRHGLENLGTGRWQADSGSIDHRNRTIDGDVFLDMAAATAERMYGDVRMQTGTAWEAWRATINRTATLLAPLGFVRPLVVPMQVALGVVQTGTGIEQALDGRTLEERKNGLEQAGMTVVTNLTLGGGLAHPGEVRVEEGSFPSWRRPPSFVAPTRVHGKIGYAMSPQRAPGFPTVPVNRLYRAPTGQLRRWDPEMLAMHTLATVPRSTTPWSPGMYARGEERFAVMRGGRLARVVADESGYRIQLNDKSAGPRIVRQRDNVFDLAFTDDNYVKGSVLAQLVDESYTVNPDALNRAAEILEQFGSSEADLLASPPRELGPLTLLALGQGIIETFPARLRQTSVYALSAREVALIAPLMAREAGRAMAFFGADGSFRFGVLANGAECTADQLPPFALRLRRHGDSYVPLKKYRPGALPEWRSVFQVAVTEMNPTRRGGEATFRANLAAALEAGSTSPELEHIHRQWVDRLALPVGELQDLKRLSRLRHAIFDRHLPLSLDQREQLRLAEEARRGALFPSEQIARPDVGDVVLLKLIDPSSELVPTEMDHLSELLASIADKHDALLPRGLRHLVVEDPAVTMQAGNRGPDQWSEGERHYVRLRHPDGRAQVVETTPPEVGEREILAPGEGPGRGTGRHVVEREGRWFPEEILREGFAIMSPMVDTKAGVKIDPRPPIAAGQNFQFAAFMVKGVPQPLLRVFGTSLMSFDTAVNGMVQMNIRDPRSGRFMNFPTWLDADGTTVPYDPPGVVLPMTMASSPQDTHLIMPMRDDLGQVEEGQLDRTNYIGLLYGEQPASAFIEAGHADRHLKTLIETRRMRGMLREDANMALVGATPEHTFTMVMPVTAETIGLVGSRAGAGRLVSDLPAGTVIVDAMYGVRATVSDYPSHVRAVAHRWEIEGVRMKRIGGDGKETRESPMAFTERLLATPVRPNLWNPARDPISELRYAEYMHKRYALSGPVSHAGLDWLETRKARREYMSYFAPPYDAMPPLRHAPLPADSPAAARMQELAEVAIDVGARPAGPVGPYL